MAISFIGQQNNFPKFGEANVIFFGGEVPIRQWLIVGLRPGGLDS